MLERRVAGEVLSQKEPGSLSRGVRKIDMTVNGWEERPWATNDQMSVASPNSWNVLTRVYSRVVERTGCAQSFEPLLCL